MQGKGEAEICYSNTLPISVDTSHGIKSLSKSDLLWQCHYIAYPKTYLGGEGEDVSDDLHGEGGRVDVRVTHHELLQNVVLDSPCQLLKLSALITRIRMFSLKTMRESNV